MPNSSKKNRDALLRAALDYAAGGMLVLPLNGKRPLTRNGVKDATTDEGTICAWWRRWPDANIGVALAASGLAAVDADPRNGSEETLAALDPFPRTVMASTGGGGTHWVFACAPDVRLPGTLGKGVDLKHHGYIVVAPSVHPDTGALYEWVEGHSPADLDPAPLPKWIAAASDRDASGDSSGDDWTVDEGARHERFVSIAGTLRHSLALTPDEIEQILNVLSPRFGDAPNREEHIAQVARSMAIYEPGKVPWEVRFGERQNGGRRQKRPDRLVLMSLAEAYAVAEEEVDWVIPDLLAAGEKAVIAGPPKSMKTWLAAHVARCVAAGGRVLGEEAWQVTKEQCVLFIQEEGSRQRWARRLKSVFFADAPRAPVYYTHRASFSLLDDRHVDWVAENAQQIGARLLVVDPWQRVTPGVRENDATETGPAWDAIHHIATETGAAVVVLHHAGKGDGQPSMDSIRGSSRMAGEVDLMIVLKKKERGTLEMFLDGRDLVRADSDEGNLEVAYDPDRPHLMRTTGFKVKVGGATNRTRGAVIAVLQRASQPLSTSDVRAGVATELGEERTRQGVDRELQVLSEEGKVGKGPQGKGRPTFWTWRG